jgi:hypothetical protein
VQNLKRKKLLFERHNWWQQVWCALEDPKVVTVADPLRVFTFHECRNDLVIDNFPKLQLKEPAFLVVVIVNEADVWRKLDFHALVVAMVKQLALHANVEVLLARVDACGAHGVAELHSFSEDAVQVEVDPRGRLLVRVRGSFDVKRDELVWEADSVL